MSKLFLILTTCLTLFAGCKNLNNDDDVDNDTKSNKDAEKIAKAMKSVSEEDAILMYKQFAGLASYMENTDKIDNTGELNGLIRRFQEDYRYDKEKYESYSDAVEEYLVEKGYDKKSVDIVKTKTKDGKSRKSVISDMRTLAKAAKIALENKKK